LLLLRKSNEFALFVKKRCVTGATTRKMNSSDDLPKDRLFADSADTPSIGMREYL
jgi:hypothetical protein